jgi:hypothetical protein
MYVDIVHVQVAGRVVESRSLTKIGGLGNAYANVREAHTGRIGHG